jgi:transglutaminase-like putative cysteine protease
MSAPPVNAHTANLHHRTGIDPKRLRVPLPTALVLLASVGIALSAGLPGFPVPFVHAFAVAAGLRLLAGRDGDRLGHRSVLQGVALLLGVVGFIWLFGYQGGGRGSVLVGFLAICAAFQSLLLLSRLRDTGAYLVIILSSVHTLGTAFLRKDLLAMVLVALYVGLAIWTLLLLERQSSMDRRRRRAVGERRLRVLPAKALPLSVAARTWGRVLGVGLPLGLLLFLVLPRFDVPARAAFDFAGRQLLADGSASAEDVANATTGPSLRDFVVDWGSVRDIQEDIRPFFEVTQLGGAGAPQNVYLRDNTMDLYEPGGRWRGSPGALTSNWTLLAPDARGWFALSPTPRPEGRSRLLKVRVLRGGFSRVYIQPWCRGARILRRGRAMRDIALARNGIDTLVLVRPGATDPTATGQRLRFEAEDVIELETVPQWQEDAALQGQRSDASTSPDPKWVALPPATRQGVLGLAQSVIGSEPDPWLRAKRLTAWLRGPLFTYTLAVPELDERERVVDFLRRARSGHCAVYASALVAMLRSLGHPARYVRGFWGGDALESRGSRLFRGKHYHAWVELHLDQVGWVPLNPTPPDRRPRDESAQAHGDAGDDFELVTDEEADSEPRGPEALLQFGKPEQDQLFAGVRERAGAFLAPLLGALRDPRVSLPLAAFGALGLLLGLWQRRRRRVRADAADSRGRLPDGPYGKALLWLARRGLRRGPHRTSQEFARDVARRMPEIGSEFLALSSHYERGRYGGDAALIADDRARALWHAIRRAHPARIAPLS